MKNKLLSFGVSILLILSITVLTGYASDSVTYSWYCQRTKDHSQPKLPSEFEFILDHGGYYLSRKTNEKVVYLTFDAGYENGNVKKTLDILKDNDVKGAFFVLNNLIKTSPDIVKRMVDDGHTVGNHTSTHKDMSKINDYNVFRDELKALEDLYTETTGRKLSNYFRPPEGKFSNKTMLFAEQMGYKTIFWSFAYADWDNNNQMSCNDAKKKIMDNLHNGAILLLHPTSNVNVMVLDEVIKEIKDQGYRFGSLDELTTNEGI